MTIEYTPDGTPYLSDQSYLSETPPYTQELAQIIDAVAAASIMPVGAIMPYMGTAAPNYWLLCDGRSYDAAYFDVLSGISANFHGDGTFRVPDLRGRSPIGTGGDGVARAWTLGERFGDKRAGRHSHHISFLNDAGGYGIFRSTGTVPQGHPAAPAVNVEANTRLFSLPYSEPTAYGGNPDYFMGEGMNYQPSTGVNFIVYAGKPTLDTNGDILPECGQGEPITTVTTRMMIEARLAEADISEEEVKMLKDQLAELKENHA